MVSLHGVSKEYRRGGTIVRALHDVTLHVERGEFCVLMGPSGCGKSTLLNLVAGLDQPTSGDIVLSGRSTRGFTDADWTRVRREVVGLIFQAFHLIPGLTAADNVALPLLLKGERGREVRRLVSQSLELVDMGHRARHRPSELSGGEQQRVAIARALVHRPSLVLADEPTGNLDSRHGADIIGLLKTLQQRLEHTILLVTHSEAAARQADRTLLLHDGRMIAAAEPMPA